MNNLLYLNSLILTENTTPPTELDSYRSKKSKGDTQDLRKKVKW